MGIGVAKIGDMGVGIRDFKLNDMYGHIVWSSYIFYSEGHGMKVAKSRAFKDRLKGHK